MADALASGASVRKDVRVQVPPRALSVFDHSYAPLPLSRLSENNHGLLVERAYGFQLSFQGLELLNSK
jgi:hypothetical protein